MRRQVSLPVMSVNWCDGQSQALQVLAASSWLWFAQTALMVWQRWLKAGIIFCSFYFSS